MLATRQLAELLGHVEQSKGKLVLVGDHRQLPEIGAGGSFLGLVRRGLAVELGENIRQVNAWEREALDQLRSGGADSALELYLRHGALAIEPSERATRDRLVREWLASAPDEDAVMIAQRRADVADLNERARARLREAGELGEVELELPGGAFAVGDAVVIKRNDLRLGVANGQRGRVTGVDPAARALSVKSGTRTSGSTARSSMTSRAAAIRRCCTATRSPATSPRARPSIGPSCSPARASAASGPTSPSAAGRLANRLYVSADAEPERAEFAPGEPGAREPLERLAAALRTSSAQVLAIDSGSSALADRQLDARQRRRAPACARAAQAPMAAGTPARARAGAARRACRNQGAAPRGARRRRTSSRGAVVRQRAGPCRGQRHNSRPARRPGDRAHPPTRPRARSGALTMPKAVARPLQPVPRYTLTRREAAASLGISLNHFERRVQPELKVVASGQLILIPVSELERWVQRHARYMVEAPVRALADLRSTGRCNSASHHAGKVWDSPSGVGARVRRRRHARASARCGRARRARLARGWLRLARRSCRSGIEGLAAAGERRRRTPTQACVAGIDIA